MRTYLVVCLWFTVVFLAGCSTMRRAERRVTSNTVAVSQAYLRDSSRVVVEEAITRTYSPEGVVAREEIRRTHRERRRVTIEETVAARYHTDSVRSERERKPEAGAFEAVRETARATSRTALYVFVTVALLALLGAIRIHLRRRFMKN